MSELLSKDQHLDHISSIFSRSAYDAYAAEHVVCSQSYLPWLDPALLMG